MAWASNWLRARSTCAEVNLIARSFRLDLRYEAKSQAPSRAAAPPTSRWSNACQFGHPPDTRKFSARMVNRGTDPATQIIRGGAATIGPPGRAAIWECDCYHGTNLGRALECGPVSTKGDRK